MPGSPWQPNRQESSQTGASSPVKLATAGRPRLRLQPPLSPSACTGWPNGIQSVVATLRRGFAQRAFARATGKQKETELLAAHCRRARCETPPKQHPNLRSGITHHGGFGARLLPCRPSNHPVSNKHRGLYRIPSKLLSIETPSAEKRCSRHLRAVSKEPHGPNAPKSSNPREGIHETHSGGSAWGASKQQLPHRLRPSRPRRP